MRTSCLGSKRPTIHKFMLWLWRGNSHMRRENYNQRNRAVNVGVDRMRPKRILRVCSATVMRKMLADRGNVRCLIVPPKLPSPPAFIVLILPEGKRCSLWRLFYPFETIHAMCGLPICARYIKTSFRLKLYLCLASRDPIYLYSVWIQTTL